MKRFIFVIIIIPIVLAIVSCTNNENNVPLLSNKAIVSEPLLIKDFHYTEVETPELSREEMEIYQTNLVRLFSKTSTEEKFNNDVTYFDSDLYGEDYRSDFLGNVGEIIDSPEKAVRHYIFYYMRQYDQTYILQRPYMVQYDDEKEVWLISTSPDYLVGRTGKGKSFMIDRSGNVLGVWEHEANFFEYTGGYFSILDYDSIVYNERFSKQDTHPVEINTAKEAAMKFEEIWGEDVIEQRPYIVHYDPNAEYWMVVGNDDYLGDDCGGVAYALFSRDGKGKLYVVHTE